MASTLDSKKRLALAVIDFLNTSLKDGTVSSEDSESIEIATSCIADTFHVDPANKSQMTSAIGSQSLLSIYSIYEKLNDSTPKPALSSASASTPPTSTPSQPPPAEAESLKSHGNAAMSRKDYTSAIDLYTRALALAPTNPIYLSNRAAAYSATHDHSAAVADAEMAVAADPKYTKAWSRLGLARYVLGDAKGSMEAYKSGIEAEGNGGSEAMKKGFKTAKEKVEEQEREREAGTEGMAEEVDGASRAGPAPGAGGMPDLGALAGMFGGGGRGGGGGMPDLGGMMNNPMFASMAQNLMRNPTALQGLMDNPQVRQMAERFGVGGGGGGGGGGEAGGANGGGAGGGGGGMPDLSSLMQDPGIAEMARNMMGGGRGGAGRGGS